MDTTRASSLNHTTPASVVPSTTLSSSPGSNLNTGTEDANFSRVLANTQQRVVPSRPPVNRWQTLGFLASHSVPLLNRSREQSDLLRILNGLEGLAGVFGSSMSYPSLSLSEYPHPRCDNGWGVHWIPTVSQTPEVVDEFVARAVEMGMKWVVFLNEGANVGANDYLVEQLTRAGIEPLMRVYTPGLTSISGDLGAMVRHYRDLGVRYFQLYNEPNLKVETNGQYPSVNKYLDLWIPAAREVIEAGGLPGFGALSPQGELDDREFLLQALNQLKVRGQANLLGRSWLAIHNYTGPRALSDPDGFLRYQQYDSIVRSILGCSLPIIGTEGGTHVTEHVSEDQQIETVTGAYDYMRRRTEPYFFTNTYWIIANGHDPAWDQHALIREDGPTRLALALKQLSSGG